MTNAISQNGAIDPSETACRQPLFEANVFRDGQIREEIDFLMHTDDPRSVGGAGIGESYCLIVETDNSPIRRQIAAENVNKRAFARAVLPNERVNAAGM